MDVKFQQTSTILVYCINMYGFSAALKCIFVFLFKSIHLKYTESSFKKFCQISVKFYHCITVFCIGVNEKNGNLTNHRLVHSVQVYKLG